MTTWGFKISDAWKPVDGASCVFLRVVFGLLLAKWGWDYLAIGRVRAFYIEPQFNFTYYGFDWVQPLPGNGMVWLFLGLIMLALGIAAGFCYRISTSLFALGFTYFFLLDRTNYQNHYYLIGLISWWLPFMPLNRMVSVDARLWPHLRSETVPSWVLWMLRFHIGLPYFFGGIAKLHPDWMLGEPLSTMLMSQKDLPILGSWLQSEGIGLGLAWMGLLFDLLIVPMLLWRRTRVLGYCLCIPFHLMNSVIFNIHVFPWFMLAATPVFFEPDWPRRVIGGKPLDRSMFQESPESVTAASPLRWARWAGLGLMLAYAGFHCVWPLRHHLYEGDASWNERGHYFAWRMMLRGKPVVLGYAIKDKVTGQVVDGNVNQFINREQSDRFGRDPEMILHFAHFLGAEYRQTTGHDAEVYALVLASLNGRKPELFIDPNVNLLEHARGFQARPWIMPQVEALRREPWSVPVERWREVVEIPQLKFLAASKRADDSLRVSDNVASVRRDDDH